MPRGERALPQNRERVDDKDGRCAICGALQWMWCDQVVHRETRADWALLGLVTPE